MTILTLMHDDVQERHWLLQSCLCASNTQHGLDFFFLQSLEVWNHCQILHYEHNNRLLLEISINITLCACMRFCYRGGSRNVWCVSVHISLPGPCYQVLTVTHEVTSYHKEMDSLWHLAICLHFSLSDIGNHILTLHSRQATTDWRLPYKASYLCFLPGVLC